MHPTFFTYPIKSKRDLLRLRQLSRHAAAILGFRPDDQICLAAAAFDLGCQAFNVARRAEARFETADGLLHIVCTASLKLRANLHLETPNSFRLAKKLPADVLITPCDFTWSLGQLAHHAPLNFFEEMQRLNRELLSSLLSKATSDDVLPMRREHRAA